MKIDYKDTHTLPFYVRFTKKEIIELVEIRKNEVINSITTCNKIIFILEGNCNINCNGIVKKNLNKEVFLFFPLGSSIYLEPLSDIQILIIRFEDLYSQYKILSLKELPILKIDKELTGILEIRKCFLYYIDTILTYLKDEINFRDLYTLKANEFLIILSNYYEEKEVATLFHSVLSNDKTFMEFILNNWHKVKSVKELSKLSNYCETGFYKRFKKTFHISPYKWLNEKRANIILHDIIDNKMSLKEICDIHGFNTLQQFNTYCKKNFNSSPNKLRKSTLFTDKNI